MKTEERDRAGERGTCQLRFVVADTGVGISPEKHQAIFEPFEQADNSTTRKYGGTGLGLAISSQLVQLMGGRMSVESELGRGSRFQFTAGFQTISGQEATLGPTEPPDVHGLRVLVVDDNATHRDILKEMLTNWRMRPTVVGSTPKAMEELRNAASAGSHYSLLLIDAAMPSPDGFELAEEVQREPGLVSGVVMMLTPTSRQANADRCAACGVGGSVLKPIKQSELLDTLLSVAGSVGTRRGGAASRQRDADETPNLPPLRVLLAEDAVINQHLAIRLLEKAGHKPRVANNGREAVEALEKESFDIVLMDVQMPELGGFEATELIREKEKSTGKHMPIIALTAHAMKGDRERCLQAGMDGYVAKPIRARELFQAMEQVLTAYAPHVLEAGRAADPPGAKAVTRPEESAMAEEFDTKAALKICGGDTDLLRELIGMFLSEIVNWMGDLEGAMKAGDAGRVNRLAHTIKGAVGNFGAQTAWDAAYRMETIGKSGELAAAGPAWEDMKRVIERLKSALAAYKG